jgi:hypothetical protein
VGHSIDAQVADAISQLEDVWEAPVAVVASNWQEERAVDLTRTAGRHLHQSLSALDAHDDLVLFLMGRGGDVAFADSLHRTLRTIEASVQALVTQPVGGVYTLAALCAGYMCFAGTGALGAYDTGPAETQLGRLDLETAAALREAGWDPDSTNPHHPQMAVHAHARQLAREMLERVLSGESDEFRARIGRHLGVERLGQQMTLDADELAALGLAASRLEDERREAALDLHAALEAWLELRGPTEPRYEETGPGGEVEFEPARNVPSAFVGTLDHHATYLMDTGQPHPDTEVLDGEWEVGARRED